MLPVYPVRLVLALAVALGGLGTGAAEPGGTFRDDDGNIHEGSIEAIAAAGVTRGCNPPANDLFCPGSGVTRGQMAAFLVRALDLEAVAIDYFEDDAGLVFEDDINRLAAAGITRGCNPPANDAFCPHQSVRRDEMASFLARALDLVPIPPPPRCSILPADNIWNRRVDDLPVAPNSAAFIDTIGATATLHADFGSGVWPPGSNSPIGIPFIEVDAGQAPVPINYTAYGSESDPGPWPVPADAPIEGGPDATGDRHVIVLDRDDCVLYELFSAYPQPDGSWNARSGARFDLTSNALRPAGWTSADAAGLPILPGLVTYDEVASGEIDHAIRFTAPETRNEYVWPARHFASNLFEDAYPPMGQRFRLKASFDISGYSPEVQVILRAMKTYGLILADNGSPWFISGAPDPRWDNQMLHEWDDIPGSAFEAVDVSSLIIDPDSGAARP